MLAGDDFDDECSENDCNNDVDMDDELINEISKKIKSDEESNIFNVLSTEEIVKLMEDDIRLVAFQFNHIPITTIRALLNFFKGISEQVTSRLYEDPEKIFKAADLANPHNMQKGKQKCKISKRNKVKECEICFTIQPLSDMSELQCEHQYCNSCWREYLQNRIMNEGCGQRLTCAEHNCNVLIDDEMVARLVDANVQRRYQHLIINNFVECNKYLTWCPAPGCGYAIQVVRSKGCQVTCKCGCVFCFTCSEIWHDPVDCNLFKKWLQKCSDESSLTTNWLLANTKECPKCNTNIEKDGGCNLMICRRKTCQYQFCWICLGNWKTHNQANGCGRYLNIKDISKKKSRETLKRYMHYYQQYINNQKSMNIEQSTLPNNIEKKRVLLQQEQGVSKKHSIYIEDAVETLRQCRETLMVTYAFAYYLEKSDNNSLIFEDNQGYLQNATESLSEALERDLALYNIDDFKYSILNKSNYCSNRREILLKFVHDGYNEGWWQFII